MWLIAMVLPVATRADPAAPAKPLGVFTVKSRLGVNPTADQIRIGESSNWRLAFARCPQSSHQPPLRVGDPRRTITKEARGPVGDRVDVTTLEMDFECGGCGGATCPSNLYCVERTSLPGIDAPVTSTGCETKPLETRTSVCKPAPAYTEADQHLRCSPLSVASCPKLGSACTTEGSTCGADVAAKASSFSNYMRCDHGTWQNVEVPPPPPPKH
jgi:hypothetical protein